GWNATFSPCTPSAILTGRLLQYFVGDLGEQSTELISRLILLLYRGLKPPQRMLRQWCAAQFTGSQADNDASQRRYLSARIILRFHWSVPLAPNDFEVYSPLSAGPVRRSREVHNVTLSYAKTLDGASAKKNIRKVAVDDANKAVISGFNNLFHRASQALRGSYCRFR